MLDSETSDVSGFLTEIGADFKKVETNHYGIRSCPFCGNDKHKLTVNMESGLWDCKVCGQTGNLRTLARAFGREVGPMKSERPQKRRRGEVRRIDEAIKPNAQPRPTIDRAKIDQLHRNLFGDERALAYVTTDRRLTAATIERFKLGLTIDGGGARNLVIPHFDGDDVVNAKLRSLPPAPRAFRRFKGHASILFNRNCLGDGVDSVFLCEGEIDTMSMVQLGYENAVGTTVGAKKSLPEEWLRDLDKASRVYFVYDSDEAGQRVTWELARQIGLNRAWNVVLPDGVKDINDFLVKGGTREVFDDLIATATQWDVKRVEHISDGIEALREELILGESEAGAEFLTFGWDSIDERAGSPEPGDLVTMLAEAKTGKTTLVNQICLVNAIKGRGVLQVNLDMPTKELARRFIQAQFRVTKEEVTEQILDEAVSVFSGLPLYLSYFPGADMDSIGDIVTMIRESVRRYNLRMVAVDNLHAIVRDSSQTEQDTATVSKILKDLAMEEQFTLVLLVQPRKVNAGVKVRPRDMKYSGAIACDADRMICIHRDDLESETILDDGTVEGGVKSPLAEIWIQSRYGKGGRVYLMMDEERGFYRLLTGAEIEGLKNVLSSKKQPKQYANG